MSFDKVAIGSAKKDFSRKMGMVETRTPAAPAIPSAHLPHPPDSLSSSAAAGS
jgi:hypothetical protein